MLFYNNVELSNVEWDSMAKATAVNTQDLSSDFQNLRKAWPDGVYHCYTELLCRDCRSTKANHQMLAGQIPHKGIRTNQKQRPCLWQNRTEVEDPYLRLSIDFNTCTMANECKPPHTNGYKFRHTHTHTAHVYTKKINKNFKIQILWQVKSHHMGYHFYW